MKAMEDGAPVVHDEDDTEGIFDAQHNIVHHLTASAGDVEAAFPECDLIALKGISRCPSSSMDRWNRISVSRIGTQDDRLVIRTATQVPFHVFGAWWLP